MDDDEIDAFRKPWELEDHWQLRKAFIQTHAERFDKDELLCLAQLFVNVETLGVKYSPDIMAKIENLSADVSYVQEYRSLKEKRDGESAERKKTRKQAKAVKNNPRHNNYNNNYNSRNNYGGNQGYGYSRNQGNQGNYGYNNGGQSGSDYNSGYQSQQHASYAYGSRQPHNQHQHQQQQHSYSSDYGYNNFSTATKDYNHQYSNNSNYRHDNNSGTKRGAHDGWITVDRRKQPRRNDNPPPSAPQGKTFGYNYNHLYSQPGSSGQSSGHGNKRNQPPGDVYQKARRY